jgi:hypothetical protein
MTTISHIVDVSDVKVLKDATAMAEAFGMYLLKLKALARQSGRALGDNQIATVEITVSVGLLDELQRAIKAFKIANKNSILLEDIAHKIAAAMAGAA